MAQPPLIALIDVSAKMGGVEFSTLYLAQKIDRSVYQVMIICPEEGELPNKCLEAAIPVKIVSQPKMFSTSFRAARMIIPNPLAWILNIFSFILIAIRLTRVLRKFEVDLVCTKGLFAHFYGGLAAHMAGLPCVWHVQDLIGQSAGNLYPFVFRKSASILADFVIADGTPIRDQLVDSVPSDRISVIYNGIDLDRFSPQVDGKAVRDEWGVGRDAILIGNVARLTPWKGQDYLIKAFVRLVQEFPNIQLVLIGSPVFDTESFEMYLHSLVKDADLDRRVIFAGFRWDLPEVLSALDIYVHSSVEKDTSPLSLVSAMASEKAIVVTDVRGVAELFLPGVDAIIVEPANVLSLANGIRQLLLDPDKCHAYARAARKKAESELSLELFARKCEHVFALSLKSVS